MPRPSVRAWNVFLGTRDADSALTELTRMVHRLDDAHDAVGYILRLVAGSPSADVEEMLRVSLTALNEAIEHLQDVAQVYRDDTNIVA